MLKKILAFSFGVTFLALTSCASAIRGSKENFVFSSNPQGATLMIFDKNNTAIAKLTTPAEIALKKGAGFFSGQNYTAKATKEGYKPSSFRIDNNLNISAYLFGNILFVGVLGYVIVDPLTGAMWNLEASNVTTDNGSIQKGARNNVLINLEKEN